MLPFASAEEQERVRRAASQWRIALDAIPSDALSVDGQRRLQELNDVADGLSRTGFGDSHSLARLGALGSLDAALWRVEASRDPIDPRVESARWEDRLAVASEALLLRQAQDDVDRASEWSSVACNFGRAIALGKSDLEAESGDAGVLEGLRSRLDQVNGDACGVSAFVTPRPNTADFTVDSEEVLRRKEKLAALHKSFAPVLQSLALPPEDVVPLKVLLQQDPLFAQSADRNAMSVMVEAAQRPDRWLIPLLAAVTGHKGGVEVISEWPGLELASLEALYVPAKRNEVGEALLVVNPSRIDGRRDWEAAAVVVDALVADCFRQMVGQVACAATRLQAAADFFDANVGLTDPRLGVGVLLQLDAYVSGDIASIDPSRSAREPDPSGHALGLLVTAADRRALASAFSAGSGASL